MRYFKDEINRYGISLRLVEIDDAEFIVSIRNDEQKKRFISPSCTNIESQRAWLQDYKTREHEDKEYYFIASENGVPFATYRGHPITEKIVTGGSWVTKPGYSKWLNSIKVDILMKELVFTEWGFEEARFDVRKENKSVVKYHMLFNPAVIDETDLDIYFSLSKQNFLDARNGRFAFLKK